METAFAWCPEAGTRRLVTGVNWSAGLINPFRKLGDVGRSLDGLLERDKLRGHHLLNGQRAEPRPSAIVESRFQLPGEEDALRQGMP